MHGVKDMRLNHRMVFVLLGTLWLLVGAMLLSVGMRLVVSASLLQGSADGRPLLTLFHALFGHFEGALALALFLGLFVGVCKGRWVMRRAVSRGVRAIQQLPNPSPMSALFSARFFLIVLVMLGMGWILRLFPDDVRGVVDIAVGAALLYGATCWYGSRCSDVL